MLLALLMAAIWMSATALVDFLIVPTLFRSLDDVMSAGIIGVKLFTIFNYLELVFGFAMIVGIWKSFKYFNHRSLAWANLSNAILLFVIALFYTSFLTPELTQLTYQIKSGGDSHIMASHDFFHKLYVKIDSIKLLLTIFSTVALSYQLRQRLKENK